MLLPKVLGPVWSFANCASSCRVEPSPSSAWLNPERSVGHRSVEYIEKNRAVRASACTRRRLPSDGSGARSSCTSSRLMAESTPACVVAMQFDRCAQSVAKRAMARWNPAD